MRRIFIFIDEGYDALVSSCCSYCCIARRLEWLLLAARDSFYFCLNISAVMFSAPTAFFGCVDLLRFLLPLPIFCRLVRLDVLFQFCFRSMCIVMSFAFVVDFGVDMFLCDFFFRSPHFIRDYFSLFCFLLGEVFWRYYVAIRSLFCASGRTSPSWSRRHFVFGGCFLFI